MYRKRLYTTRWRPLTYSEWFRHSPARSSFSGLPGVRIPATFLPDKFPLFHEQKGGTLKTFIRATLSVSCTCCLIAQVSLISLAQSTADVLAVVNRQAITTADLKPFLPPSFDSFEPDKAFAVQKVALENAIISLLLKAEARRRKISVPTLRRQMTAGRVRVPDSQIEEEFLKNARYFGLLSPDEAKERLRLDLEAEERMKLYKAALTRLRALAKVDVRLETPEAPTVSLIGNGPTKGPPSAAVTITIFSDFQCPYCKESQKVLAQVIKKYPEDVRLVFRHLPVRRESTELTPAIAAVCADRQGRFWSFHDAVYERGLFTAAGLRLIAIGAELDMAQFDICVASRLANNVIRADLAEARRLKIDGTPTFIVNGRIYKGTLEFDEFKEIIEGQLRSSARGHKP